ncbi:MAG: hypothetical protein ABWY48_00895 [Pseudoxanthomonas sp.]
MHKYSATPREDGVHKPECPVSPVQLVNKACNLVLDGVTTASQDSWKMTLEPIRHEREDEVMKTLRAACFLCLGMMLGTMLSAL